MINEDKKHASALKVDKAVRDIRRRDRLPNGLVGDPIMNFETNNNDSELDQDSLVNNTELLSKRTTLAMKYTAEVCKQYNISDRAGSKVWNAVVKDLEEAGYLKKDESRDIIEELIVDRFKMRRSKQKFGEEVKFVLKDSLDREGGQVCIGADGKRDKKTRIEENLVLQGEDVVKRRVGQEEHQVYTKEPEGSYLDHSAIPEGTGRGLAMDFLGMIADTGSKKTLRVVLMDGCGVNLGWKIGMFVTIERELGCQLQTCK